MTSTPATVGTASAPRVCTARTRRSLLGRTACAPVAGQFQGFQCQSGLERHSHARGDEAEYGYRVVGGVGDPWCDAECAARGQEVTPAQLTAGDPGIASELLETDDALAGEGVIVPKDHRHRIIEQGDDGCAYHVLVRIGRVAGIAEGDRDVDAPVGQHRQRLGWLGLGVDQLQRGTVLSEAGDQGRDDGG